MLAQYLINRDKSNPFMESFLDYLVGVIYLKTADLSEMEQELQGVLYTFPRSESKSVYSFLCTVRGAFITLNHLLPSIAGPQPVRFVYTHTHTSGLQVNITLKTCV